MKSHLLKLGTVWLRAGGGMPPTEFKDLYVNPSHIQSMLPGAPVDFGLRDGWCDGIGAAMILPSGTYYISKADFEMILENDKH
jgi:hypothetical protein